MYKSIFLKTTAGIALSALLVAQGYDWANESWKASASLLGWALLGAVVAGVLAVAWAFVSSPAITPIGRALREAVQALLGLPIAQAILSLTTSHDVFDLGQLVVPTVIAVVFSFVIAYLRNLGVVPEIPGARPAGADFAGTGAVVVDDNGM